MNLVKDRGKKMAYTSCLHVFTDECNIEKEKNGPKNTGTFCYLMPTTKGTAIFCLLLQKIYGGSSDN